MAASRLSGILKKWFEEKGYGFIRPDGGGHDIFLHVSELKKAGIQDPAEEDRFFYDTEAGRNPGSFRAVNIERA